ncbi:MAG: NADH-quinone oxidoreductase subunit J [Deltaproteobacteria bacterium HGW-Deltaproteobacteria-23]|jgi:NADH-quinone oxidoreductase subunit J|nr:MAG: NADH-quinone oxidoreductase subunit J [Deltaproteobacteria bacterium HGW-Deltaproteobacteria-23]
METLFFLIVATIAVISSILVVTNKNPINSALSLIMTFFCLATLYVMLEAPFMAAIQIIVYAGAIMVLIVFVIMLLNVKTEAGSRGKHALFLGSMTGLLLLIQTWTVIGRSSMTGTQGNVDSALISKVGHTELIGTSLFTDFLLPFEITSILLLVAIVGAVILSKKKL